MAPRNVTSKVMKRGMRITRRVGDVNSRCASREGSELTLETASAENIEPGTQLQATVASQIPVNLNKFYFPA